MAAAEMTTILLYKHSFRAIILINKIVVVVMVVVSTAN